MSQEASGILPSELINIGKESFLVKAADLFDLRSAFAPILNVAAMPDGDDDDDDDADKGGDGGSGDGGGDDGSSGTDATKDDVKDPDKKKLSDEAAKHRNNAKAEKQRADELAAKLKEIEDKDKSELEKAQSDLKEAQERLVKLEETTKTQAVRLAFFESGAAAQFRNPATALKLMKDDLKDITPDEDGEVDVKAIKTAADDLLKREPYLGKDEDGDDDKSTQQTQQPSGRQTNGKTKKDGLNKEALAQKFPALRGR